MSPTEPMLPAFGITMLPPVVIKPPPVNVLEAVIAPVTASVDDRVVAPADNVDESVVAPVTERVPDAVTSVPEM